MNEVFKLMNEVNTKEGKYRARAIKKLGKIKDPRVFDFLITTLTDEAPRIRRLSANALGEIGDPRAVVHLLSATNDADTQTSFLAATALRKIGSDAVDSLIAILKDKDSLLRSRSAIYLGNFKDPRAVIPLIEVLNDRDSVVRRNAAEALGNIKDDRAVIPLIGVLEDDDLDVQKNVSFALAKIKNQRAVKPLIKKLKDKNSRIEYFTVKALGKLKAQKAVKPLIKILRNQQSELRCEAAVALGEIGGSRAVVPLLHALNDEYLEKEASDALIAIGTPSVKLLLKELNNKNSLIRAKAARTLGGIRDPRAVPFLIEALKENDWDLNDSIESALINTGDLAVEQLVEILTDWKWNRVIAEILFNIGWKPQADKDRIHYFVAQRKRSNLWSEWDTTKIVLLNDLDSKVYSLIQYALYAFIGIGNEEIIPVLIEKLYTKGNKTMAEAYLNCGNKILSEEARMWAEKKGYTIKIGRGAHPANWGSF